MQSPDRTLTPVSPSPLSCLLKGLNDAATSTQSCWGDFVNWLETDAPRRCDPPLPAPPRPSPPHRSRPAPPRPIVPAPPRPAPSFPPHHPLFPFRRLVLNSPNPRPNLTLPRPMCMVLENHWNNGPRASEDHTEFDLDHVTPPRPHVSRCPTPCPPSHARALAFAPRRPRRRSAAMASRW